MLDGLKRVDNIVVRHIERQSKALETEEERVQRYYGMDRYGSVR